MHPPVGLQHTDHEPGDGAEGDAEQQGERQVDHRGQAGEPVPHPGRHDGAQQQLALGADVEQARLHADDHGQAGEDQRRRLLEHGADRRPVGQRTTPHGLGRLGRALAVGQHHHGPDEEGDHDRQQRQQRGLHTLSVHGCAEH
ncbi:MAG: hypothetical protein R2755_15235 [Acidimicrobiales bacterium]